MFEVGRRYTITMSDASQPGTVHYIRGKVMEFQFPLLKLGRRHLQMDSWVHLRRARQSK